MKHGGGPIEVNQCGRNRANTAHIIVYSCHGGIYRQHGGNYNKHETATANTRNIMHD